MKMKKIQLYEKSYDVFLQENYKETIFQNLPNDYKLEKNKIIFINLIIGLILNVIFILGFCILVDIIKSDIVNVFWVLLILLNFLYFMKINKRIKIIYLNFFQKCPKCNNDNNKMKESSGGFQYFVCDNCKIYYKFTVEYPDLPNS